jgi:hypothetical protein
MDPKIRVCVEVTVRRISRGVQILFLEVLKENLILLSLKSGPLNEIC